VEIREPDDRNSGESRQRLARRHRLRLIRGLNSSTSILLCAVLALMINYLASRHYIRLDWTSGRQSTLSGKTAALLASMENDALITVLMQTDHEVMHLVYDDLLHMLAAYEYAAKGRIQIEQVDPDRQPGRTLELMARFELEEPNAVVIEYGERAETIDGLELAEIDYGPVMHGGLPRRKSFKGEQRISSALVRLIEQEPARVYFIQGHGERDFSDYDPHTGMNRIAAQIRRDHIELLPLRFSDYESIPSDADALIVAAPTRTYTNEEVDRLRGYFNNSGRILLMMSGETDAGLAPLLENWGIRSIDSIVVDPERTQSGYEVLVDSYEDHPVTARLNGLSSVLYWPRALPLLETKTQETKTISAVLACSSRQSWAETDLAQRPPALNPETDIAGPIPLILAVGSDSQTGSIGIDAGKAVIFGDAEMISNTGLAGANADLMLNALNWLLERDSLLDIAPREETDQALIMEARGLRRLFWLVVIAIPLAAAMAGSIVWWKRRR